MKQTNILTHFAAAAIATISCALIYVTVQQSYRSAADDPQFQIARDISAQLKNGRSVATWFETDTAAIEESLSVFQTLYNDKKQPVLSTGLLHGKLPALPEGVFDDARKYGENVFTWQPERGVRVAIVLHAVQSPAFAFIAVGRSLNEIEKREANLRWMVVIAWLLCMGIIILHWLINFLRARKMSNV